MYDLRRIRYVTENYRDLRGLTLVPYSLWFLGWAALDAGWLSTPGWLSNEYILFGVWLLVASALAYVIARLYDRVFGSVAPNEDQSGELDWPVFIALLVTPWVIVGAAELIPSLSEIGMTVSISSVAIWWDRRENRWVLALGIVVAIMTLGPLLQGLVGPVYPSPTVREIAIKLVTAIGILLIATRTHLMLVRTLGPIRHEEESRA